MTFKRMAFALAASIMLSSQASQADEASNVIRVMAPIAQGASWSLATPLVSPWANDGAIYDCSNWSPSPSTVAQGSNFTQTATDCSQLQKRTSQQREFYSKTQEYRNLGVATVETQVITVSGTRTAVGTQSTVPDPYLAVEGNPFRVTETTIVRYGINGASRDKSFAAGAYNCSSSIFGGDPAPGKVKYCWVP